MSIVKHTKYQHLLDVCKGLPPMATAVVHPCDTAAIEGAAGAARLGLMLAKSLSFLAGADAAGIVLGARVPIILTSRADSDLTRLASCAVGALVARARRSALAKAVG